jgi:CRP/FNR family transcriptional regulator, cyclic AMP receptor protein
VARRATNQQLVDTLRAIPLFGDCSKKELSLLARTGKQVDYTADHVIVAQGDTEGAGLHVLLDGEAKVEVNGRTRRRLGPGDFFGEIALLDGGPRTASVITTTPARVLFIARWNFREVLSDQPALALRMLEVVARRLRTTTAPGE